MSVDTDLRAPRRDLLGDPEVRRAIEKRDMAREELRRFERLNEALLSPNWEKVATEKEMEATKADIEKDGAPDPGRPNLITRAREERPRAIAHRDVLTQRLLKADAEAWELAYERASNDVPAVHENLEAAAEKYLAIARELDEAKNDLGRAWSRLSAVHSIARGVPSTGPEGVGLPVSVNGAPSPEAAVKELRRLIEQHYGAPTTERPIPAVRRLQVNGDRIHRVPRSVARDLERAWKRDGKRVDYVDGFPAESELPAVTS
ncbi:hypothetical protein [Actinomadura sp. SCN-SB]|uniref:hypothetical protein n=1 Tax=Actinomadura sp. SCN-SB TaxID=3373092 RepID=UPI0037525C4A